MVCIIYIYIYYIIFIIFSRVVVPANPMDEVFGMLTTEELLRMLELLDMLEHNKPIYASENELATLAYLLKSTRGSGMTSSY